MLLVDHAVHQSNTFGQQDEDVVRLFTLMDNVYRLSTDVSDAGSALRSLMGGLRTDDGPARSRRDRRVDERAMLAS